MEERKLRHEIWPNVIMLCGFGVAAICLGLLLFKTLSPAVIVVISIAENIAIGVGSIGIGGRITQARRERCV